MTKNRLDPHAFAGDVQLQSAGLRSNDERTSAKYRPYVAAIALILGWQSAVSTYLFGQSMGFFGEPANASQNTAPPPSAAPSHSASAHHVDVGIEPSSRPSASALSRGEPPSPSIRVLGSATIMPRKKCEGELFLLEFHQPKNGVPRTISKSYPLDEQTSTFVYFATPSTEPKIVCCARPHAKIQEGGQPPQDCTAEELPKSSAAPVFFLDVKTPYPEPLETVNPVGTAHPPVKSVAPPIQPAPSPRQ